MRISKLPASQQLFGIVTPAFDQLRTTALPLQIVCHLLGSRRQLHPTGPRQPAYTLSRRTSLPRCFCLCVCLGRAHMNIHTWCSACFFPCAF